jgi:two-component system sensor histidine kinase TctE
MSLLAHDMRNPLSAVLTNVNYVKASLRGRAPEVEEALSDSALSCAMLGQVISNLDVLARTLASSPLSARPIVARRAADEAVARFALHAAVTGVRLEVREVSKTSAVLVEPTFFTRALDNLVANAIQYSPPNGEVTIECAEQGDKVVLSILDEGTPIPLELRELAVSADWQGQAKQRYEARYGRGLSLYCASEAARLAGAQLKIGDRDGRSSLELSADLAR